MPTFGDSGILLDKLHELTKQAEKRGNTKLVATLREDAEKFSETGSIAASDRYAGIIYSSFTTALDYIPQEALVFLDKPTKIAETATSFFKQHAEDLNILLESGLIAGQNSAIFSSLGDGRRKAP